MKEKIPLYKQWLPDEAYDDVNEILRNGENWSNGKWCRKFEDTLSEFLDLPDDEEIVVCSSGTAALYIATKILKSRSDNLEYCHIPGFTYYSLPNIAKHLNLKPIFHDIDLGTLCYQEKVESENDYNLVYLVHQCGFTPHWLNGSYYERNVIEDAACAFGGVVGDKKVGTIGEMSCFSFHARKTISTGGEGGAIRLKTKYNYMARAMVANGVFDGCFEYPGSLNFKMTDLQACIGYHQLMHIAEISNHYYRIAKCYFDNLLNTGQSRYTLVGRLKPDYTYQSMPILIDHPFAKDRLKKEGIDVSRCGYILNESMPNAHFASQKCYALPIGMHVTEEDANYISGKIKELL